MDIKVGDLVSANLHGFDGKFLVIETIKVGDMIVTYADGSVLNNPGKHKYWADLYTLLGYIEGMPHFIRVPHSNIIEIVNSD